jgi:hypothetical protein
MAAVLNLVAQQARLQDPPHKVTGSTGLQGKESNALIYLANPYVQEARTVYVGATGKTRPTEFQPPSLIGWPITASTYPSILSVTQGAHHQPGSTLWCDAAGERTGISAGPRQEISPPAPCRP